MEPTDGALVGRGGRATVRCAHRRRSATSGTWSAIVFLDLFPRAGCTVRRGELGAGVRPPGRRDRKLDRRRLADHHRSRPPPLLQFRESDTTRSAGAGLAAARMAAGRARAWGRTVRLPPAGAGGASASPAVAASWTGARSESRRPAVEPTRRTATMTNCLGVRGAASETDDDLQAAGRGGRRIGGPDADPWTEDQRRRAQPARRAECGDR